MLARAAAHRTERARRRRNPQTIANRRTVSAIVSSPMSEHARAPASRPSPPDLVDVDALLARLLRVRPDPSIPAQRVAFGTSGHRGSAFKCRVQRGAHPGHDRGHLPLPVRAGLHAARCSSAATRTRCPSPPGGRRSRCWSANGVDVRVDADDGFTPTPAVSHAILVANRGDGDAGGLADGIVVTPSHNPPDDGGFKYNPPNGGPADTDVTRWIQDEANRILEASGGDGLDGIARVPFERARARRPASTTSGRRTSPTSATSSTWPRSRRRACASASTRSVARRSPTGRRSGSGTGST